MQNGAQLTYRTSSSDLGPGGYGRGTLPRPGVKGGNSGGGAGDAEYSPVLPPATAATVNSETVDADKKVLTFNGYFKVIVDHSNCCVCGWCSCWCFVLDLKLTRCSNRYRSHLLKSIECDQSRSTTSWGMTRSKSWSQQLPTAAFFKASSLSDNRFPRYTKGLATCCNY